MNKILRIFVFGVVCFSISPNANAQDKVVVIPLFGDEAKCEWRESVTANLNGFYKRIDSFCQQGERVISGGHRFIDYNSRDDCRVVESFPILGNGVQDRWRVTWAQPTSTECAAAEVLTLAFCCK